MQVCREKKGSAKSFQCFYHGWIFGLDGKLRSQPGEEGYDGDFKSRDDLQYDARPQVRILSRFPFHFVRSQYHVRFADYLAGAKEYIDLVCDQSVRGMSITPGTQEYSMRANWKLLTENSIDGYHATTTHASYFDYLGEATGCRVGRRGIAAAWLRIRSR